MKKSIASVGILLSLLTPSGLTSEVNAATETTKLVSSVSVVSAKEWKCPKWHSLLRKYKLPVATFDPILFRESRCNERVIGWNYRAGTSHRNCKLAPAEQYRKCKAVKSYDSGLLQINSSWVTLTSQVCGSKYGNLKVLLDAECNIKVASYLFHEGGGLSNWRGTSGKS